MTSLSSWVLSIAGICFVSVVLDLMLPDGKTNSHIKNIVSYAIILVVVIPLPNLLNKNFSASDIFEKMEINIQEDYIYNINQSKLDALCKQIEEELTEKGILGVEVSISANIFDNPMEINAVYVDLYNVVISDNKGNIYIKTEVVEVVVDIINISKDKVVFYEWKEI